MKDLKIILLIACTTLLSIGCDIINPEEPLPTLIYIAEPSFQVRNAQEGTANQNITEFWVTANGDFLGAYPVPSVVPILASGNIDLKIQAGTRDNGISATPELYPFFKDFTISTTLEALERDTVRPTFFYDEGTEFVFSEGFESTGTILLSRI